MDIMITMNDEFINSQTGDLKNKIIFDRQETYKFRFILISGHKNPFIQYCFNEFYHDIDEIKRPSFFDQFCIGANIQFVV